MNKRSPLCTTSLALFCVATLAACGQQDVQPSAESTTLRLERLADGNLRYCETDSPNDEDCSTLPYEGQCEVIEVNINLSTGQTCERCINSDGTVTDRGCTDTFVACTMVTIPEPDCTVCAYVNGAIIYSTCIADEPQCRTDDDCRDGFGHNGRCEGGECFYPEGCSSDRDCRDNETCEMQYCSDRPCLEGEECPPCYGRCVPKPTGCDQIDCAPGHHCEIIEVCADGTSDDRPTDPNICSREVACVPDDKPVDCRDDADCPADFVCREMCTLEACREGDTDCGTCYGTCVPEIQNPCDDFVCRDGQHCELQQVECVRAPCPPMPICIDDATGCQSDGDCGTDQACILRCPMCLPGSDCPPCDGVCVDVAPGCIGNEECRSDDGQQGVCWEGACHFRFNCDARDAMCKMMLPVCPDGQSITVVGACYGPCVPDALCEPPPPTECKSDADCPNGNACVEVCIGGGCDPAGEFCDVGCRSTCEPTTPPNQCDSDSDCPEGDSCAFVCAECAPDSSDCVGGCWGTCIDNPECASDRDCLSSDGTQGQCVKGQCLYAPNGCGSDADCADGQACRVECSGLCAAGDAECPTYCRGVCVDLPDPPADDCKRTGCSGQICALEDVASTCEWRPEYACFDRAICELQADGICGWTPTEDQRQCLDNLEINLP